MNNVYSRYVLIKGNILYIYQCHYELKTKININQSNNHYNDICHSELKYLVINKGDLARHVHFVVTKYST